MSYLICPVCKKELNMQNNSLKCANNHAFDFAKEGYVNLLLGSKSGDKTGDSKDSARARHNFLDKDYYLCLKEYISSKFSGVVLDICCGEGYYDTYSGELYGFDISKEMVRLAAKRHKGHNYFVANLAAIPIAGSSIDTAIELFAPFNEKEIFRVMKPGAKFYYVIGGENHLWEMKQCIYDTPYKNEEKAPKTELLKFVSANKISRQVNISKDDLKILFSMTPYFYKTSKNDKEKLNTIDSLNLTVEFVIFEYEKEI